MTAGGDAMIAASGREPRQADGGLPHAHSVLAEEHCESPSLAGEALPQDVGALVPEAGLLRGDGGVLSPDATLAELPAPRRTGTA